MADDDSNEVNWTLLPPGTEAPEGDVALAEQAESDEDAPGIDLGEERPVPVGTTWAYDFVRRRFLADGPVPQVIGGRAAQRQAIEKALRTPRGVFVVCGPDFGIDVDREVINGGPFDAAAFAEWEAAARDAIEAFPWVLEISDFEGATEDGDDAAFVSFIVTAEGTDDDDADIVFDGLRLQPQVS